MAKLVIWERIYESPKVAAVDRAASRGVEGS